LITFNMLQYDTQAWNFFALAFISLYLMPCKFVQKLLSMMMLDVIHFSLLILL
jgi:hypothetical protein